jgi:hypothetical protein
MNDRRLRYELGTLLALSSLIACPAIAQDAPSGSETVTLTVQAGVPLHVVLEKKVPIKLVGAPVEGHTVEPIYVFDHLVIPSGTKITGRVSKVVNLTRKQRAMTIANGDFTPYRKPYLDFDTLVFKDGSKLPIQTAVTQGAPNMVHLSAGDQGKKKGRVSQAVEQARAEAKAREQETMKDITAPGKTDRLKQVLLAELPYHKQALQAGTHFTAELKAPLELGTEERSAVELTKLGSEIPPGSVVHVRLTTPLSSATDHKGAAVTAVVSEPVFSSDHQLILPEGARLQGLVTQALPARRMGRNGQLRFMFRQVEMGPGAPRNVEASLHSVDAASGAHMVLDEEGGAHAVTPKSKLVAPTIKVLLAVGSLDGLDPHNKDRIEDGLGPQGPDVAGGAVRGGAGLGLVGTIVGLAAHYRPVSACFAFYGAGLSVYTHVVARGNDVVFTKNTPMEIKFGIHESPATPAAKPNPFVAGI